MVFGDAAKREVLMAAGAMRAKAVVITFADTHASERIIDVVRQLRSDLPVIVRTIDDSDIEQLRHAGADEVVFRGDGGQPDAGLPRAGGAGRTAGPRAAPHPQRARRALQPVQGLLPRRQRRSGRYRRQPDVAPAQRAAGEWRARYRLTHRRLAPGRRWRGGESRAPRLHALHRADARFRGCTRATCWCCWPAEQLLQAETLLLQG